MSDDFGAALREYTAAKAELEDILESDPENVELKQVSGIRTNARLCSPLTSHVHHKVCTCVQVLHDLNSAIRDAQEALDAAEASGSVATAAPVLGVESAHAKNEVHVPKVIVNRDAPASSSRQGLHTSKGGSNAAATAQLQRIWREEEPDFAQLAARYPELSPHVKVGPRGRGSIEFTNFEASRYLITSQPLTLLQQRALKQKETCS